MSSLIVFALRTVVTVMLVHLAATNLEFVSESHTLESEILLLVLQLLPIKSLIKLTQ